MSQRSFCDKLFFFIPEIKDGAKEFLEELYIMNYKIILFTTRNSELAKDWLVKNNIDKYFSEITNVKKPAMIYLDDRAICFNGDYKKSIENIKNFKPYWKNKI